MQTHDYDEEAANSSLRRGQCIALQHTNRTVRGSNPVLYLHSAHSFPRYDKQLKIASWCSLQFNCKNSPEIILPKKLVKNEL